MTGESERIDEAERLRPYFEVQLLFAERLATLGGTSLSAAARRYTNMHRRLGLADEDPAEPRRRRFDAGLDQPCGPHERLDWVVGCYADTPPSADAEPRFGCFRFDPPDPDGVVRLHFSNRDLDGISPLAAGKIELRQGELAQMCAHVSLHHPGAKVVAGRSWLYNLDAYRRLFPPTYVASRSAPTQVSLDGASTWGQLLTHRGEVKASVRDEIVGKLPEVELAAPWRVFPLRALNVQAPFEAFQDHFAGRCGPR